MLIVDTVKSEKPSHFMVFLHFYDYLRCNIGTVVNKTVVPFAIILGSTLSQTTWTRFRSGNCGGQVI